MERKFYMKGQRITPRTRIIPRPKCLNNFLLQLFRNVIRDQWYTVPTDSDLLHVGETIFPSCRSKTPKNKISELFPTSTWPTPNACVLWRYLGGSPTDLHSISGRLQIFREMVWKQRFCQKKDWNSDFWENPRNIGTECSLLSSNKISTVWSVRHSAFISFPANVQSKIHGTAVWKMG